MRVIVQGNKRIEQLLTKKIQNDVIYRPSSYLLIQRIEDGFLFCNTVTGALAYLTEDEKRVFDDLPSFPNDNYKDLIKHGYVVRSDCDELQIVEQLRAVFLKLKESRRIINNYNILPTTGCNARCFYCYQSDIKHVSMTKETADQLISFIATHHSDEKVKLSWFGGEPTLCIPRINQICNGLKELNIDFESEMVTNGYLFDSDLVKHAKNTWNLKTIQITLDGTEEVYNKTKAYVGIKDNAFVKVMRNVKLLLDEKIYVNIRLNFDDHNGKDLKKLIKDLTNEFSSEATMAIYIRQLDENVGFNPIKHSSSDIKRLKKEFIELQQLLENNGWSQIWRFVLPSLVTCSCMADDPTYIQCTPDGLFSKCEDYINEHIVGDLANGINNRGEVLWLRQRICYESCKKCPLFPSCRKLLKNCPVRTQECDINNRDMRIKRCREIMVQEYNKWKKLNSEK